MSRAARAPAPSCILHAIVYLASTCILHAIVYLAPVRARALHGPRLALGLLQKSVEIHAEQ